MAFGPSMPPATANTFNILNPDLKVTYPTPTKRKKRFAKIREVIEGKREGDDATYPTKTRQFSTPTT